MQDLVVQGVVIGLFWEREFFGGGDCAAGPATDRLRNLGNRHTKEAKACAYGAFGVTNNSSLSLGDDGACVGLVNRPLFVESTPDETPMTPTTATSDNEKI